MPYLTLVANSHTSLQISLNFQPILHLNTFCEEININDTFSQASDIKIKAFDYFGIYENFRLLFLSMLLGLKLLEFQSQFQLSINTLFRNYLHIFKTEGNK